VIVAFVTTAISLYLGVTLARLIGPVRFWGRPFLAVLSLLPLAIMPSCSALGLLHGFSPLRVGQLVQNFTRSELFFGQSWDRWISWLWLVWVGVISATPIVALSVKAALGRVSPSWTDAGRAFGASRSRAWRQLVWPILRPEVARTLAAVFAIALLEPSAPIILGLRRTLGFQLVDAISRDAPSTRLAMLALIGLGLSLLGRALIRWWGGNRVHVSPLDRQDRPERLVWWRACFASVGLLVWIGFALLPLVGLAQIIVGPWRPDEDRAWVTSAMSTIYAILSDPRTGSFDPDFIRVWKNAFGLGLSVTLIDAFVIGLVQRTKTTGRPSLMILGLERVPPLVLGLAAALLPSLILLLGERFHMSSWIQLSKMLDPVRWPGLVLIGATAAMRLPMLARAADRSDLRTRPGLLDAAISLGATPRKARKLSGGRGPSWGVLILTFTLATTSVTPALVLTPTIRTRTLGPALVAWFEDRPRAALFAFGSIGLNLAGLVAARRGRSGAAGDWYRG
jgi:ABC-type Fe3+ transport system permease subunit